MTPKPKNATFAIVFLPESPFPPWRALANAYLPQ